MSLERVGGPPDGAGLDLRMAGEGNDRDMARDPADPGHRLPPARRRRRDRVRGVQRVGVVAGSTGGAALRRGRGAW